MKEKSTRNKTIDTSVEEGRIYLNRCITVDSKINSIQDVTNKTILGDNLKVLSYLPSESVDLIIADPPYNLTRMYGDTKFSRRRDSDYIEFTKAWIYAIERILKPRGSIYICADWETSLLISPIIQQCFMLRNRITWQREKGRGAQFNWKNGMEDIWFATKGSEYTFNLDAVKIRRKVIAPYRVDGTPKDWEQKGKDKYRDTCPSNFWDDITIPFWSMPENTAHPTQKPEKLIAKIILASSNEGDIILDPFLGSGTTSVVAKKLNRRYIGIELEEQYCIWAEQRLELAELNKGIQGYVDGVFWERNSSPP